VLYCCSATALTNERDEVEEGTKRATGLWLYSIFEFQRGVGNMLGCS